ncbi:hypothetical protein [Yoonia vestfoldensis]|uniref:hypothetical protein n=1 Tax=Yoonia vestfoldensis TaxID=245188 RepID=UPI000379A6F6|nr:hypothetical protein [Yoonia vestfoldensis]
MKKILILPLIALAACEMPAVEAPVAEEVATIPAMTLPPAPPRTARTVEQFDTTSAAERQAATQVSAGGAEIGNTIATLGSPTEPGIWLKTPLVTAVTQGRIRYQGRTINAELRPSGGAAGSGSQISLAAMRLIEAPLTGLVDLTVLR